MNCGLCRNSKNTALLTVSSYHLVKCTECGLVYTSDFDNRKTSYTEKDYFIEKNQYISRWEEFCGIFEALLEKIICFKRGGKLLDVGAGVGTLLSIAKRQGFVAQGVEVSPWASAFAREEKGLDVLTGNLEDLRLDADTFDVIVINHVLEHVSEPQALLLEARRILKNDGLLVIGVPNIGSIMAGLQRGKWPSLRPEEHIWHFTPATIKRILAMTGFKITRSEAKENHPTTGWGPKSFIKKMIDFISVLTDRSEAMVVFAQIDYQRQSLHNLKGEIDFRKKLFQQQINGERFFNDEFDAKEIEKILDERMKKTFSQILSLKEREFPLSPYVEIGAERCQRSLVMENDLTASGAAVDISFDMLKGCDYYARAFNKTKLPLRVCCDVNNLPFMSGSIPFVFCYETLHHFPDPAPIIKEVHRILSPGGHFFFDEEPFKKAFFLNLYPGEKMYAKKRLNRNVVKKILDYFFSKIDCNEVAHGIIENDEISPSAWKLALGCFAEKDVRLHSLGILESKLFNPRNPAAFFLSFLFGGLVSGVCTKSGVYIKREFCIRDVIVCPSCMENGCELKLTLKDPSFCCNECGSRFPLFEGVAFLLPHQKLKELYPGIFEMLAKTDKIR